MDQEVGHFDNVDNKPIVSSLLSNIAKVASILYNIDVDLPTSDLSNLDSQYSIQINKLSCLLDDLANQQQYLKLDLPPKNPVESYTLFQSENFVVCVFVLQKGAHLPIHDHPSMTVLTKVISGTLDARLYEISGDVNVDTLQVPAIEHRFVMTPDSKSFVIRANDTTANLHSLTALTDNLIFFDIIGPPYHSTTRPCTYFISSMNDDQQSNNSSTNISSPKPFTKSYSKKHNKHFNRRNQVSPPPPEIKRALDKSRQNSIKKSVINNESQVKMKSSFESLNYESMDNDMIQLNSSLNNAYESTISDYIIKTLGDAEHISHSNCLLQIVDGEETFDQFAMPYLGPKIQFDVNNDGNYLITDSFGRTVL